MNKFINKGKEIFMSDLDNDVNTAVDQNLDNVINAVASDSIMHLLDKQNLSPEQIDFDERAIANATHVAVAGLTKDVRDEAITVVAMTAPMLLRVSRPGDGTSTLLTTIESKAGGATKVAGLKDLRLFNMASQLADTFGPVSVGIDTAALAD
ncbi:MAG: hypothetical protein ACM34I_07720, partial [bacterium]